MDRVMGVGLRSRALDWMTDAVVKGICRGDCSCSCSRNENGDEEKHFDARTEGVGNPGTK